MADLALELIRFGTDVTKDANAVGRSNQALKEMPQQQHPIFYKDPVENLAYSVSFGGNCYCGKKFVREIVKQDEFVCPVCRVPRQYKQKKISLYYHYMYVFQLCLVEKFEDYIKCESCENHFCTDVLKNSSIENQEEHPKTPVRGKEEVKAPPKQPTKAVAVTTTQTAPAKTSIEIKAQDKAAPKKPVSPPRDLLESYSFEC